MIPSYSRSFAIIAVALMFCCSSSFARAQSFNPNDPNAAHTADVTGSKKAGQPVANMKVNGKTVCSYGDKYRYVFETAGWLVAQSDINCPGSATSNVSDTVCTNNAKSYPQLPAFDKDLTCTGAADTPAGNVNYKVDERGIMVNGITYPWTNPQQAPALLALLKEKTGGNK